MKTMLWMTTMATLMTLTACTDGNKFKGERSQQEYESAVAEYNAGRIEEALKGFEAAVKSDPMNASARFQLAVLLQDNKHDYLGAICAYRDYQLLAPASDKAAVAQERAEVCERMLARQLADKLNLTDNSAVHEQLATEQQARAQAETELAELRKQLTKVQGELELARKESAQRKAVIDRFSSFDDEEVAPISSRDSVNGQVARAREVMDDDSPAPQSTRSQDGADEGGSVRVNPLALALNEDSEQDDVADLLPKLTDEERKAFKEAKRSAAAADKAAREAKSTTEVPRPKTYVVKEGDNLTKIARELYGDASMAQRIQQANKVIVPINGTIKPGQTLRIP